MGGGGKVEGGTQRWAVVRGQIVVLATPFGVTAETLASLSGLIRGRNKIVLDITNAQAHIFKKNKSLDSGFTQDIC